ncbi:hypothetical protein [Eudoraea adriatica]|uniref:hypothetical protein n=1 Tax=Eudoraea adriatica TaxID=446681 RepID=UPI0012FBE700|nr:hypothetical protein [Eudoraea adriatica]
MEINKKVIETIKNHYLKNYGQSARMKEIENDSELEISFYNIPECEFETDYLLMSISIPKKNNRGEDRKMLRGHLNSDQKEDLIITVYTLGGGFGALSRVENEYFVFLRNKNNYALATIISDSELVNCQNGGRFSAFEIQNGNIIGTTYCYDVNDPSCCPTLAFSTELEFTNEKLVIVKQDEIIK